MKTTDEGATSTDQTAAKAQKGTAATKYLNQHLQSPVEVANDHPGEDPNVMDVDLGTKILNDVTKQVGREFYQDNRAFVITPEEVLELDAAASELCVEDDFESAHTKASVMIEAMVAEKKPRMCISAETFKSARELAVLRERLRLTKKYEKKLIGGKELRLQLDMDFENLCKDLHLGRRTRITIDAKKKEAQNQTVLEDQQS
jgi:hypothetical protein